MESVASMESFWNKPDLESVCMKAQESPVFPKKAISGRLEAKFVGPYF